MSSQLKKLQKKQPKPKPAGKEDSSGNMTTVLTLWDRVTNRLGPSGGLLLLMFFAVKSLAGDDTEEAIVREIFFGKTTGHPYVGIFFGALVLFTLIDASLVVRYIRGERREMKRLRAEVRRLQGEQLGLEEEQEQAS